MSDSPLIVTRYMFVLRALDISLISSLTIPWPNFLILDSNVRDSGSLLEKQPFLGTALSKLRALKYKINRVSRRYLWLMALITISEKGLQLLSSSIKVTHPFLNSLLSLQLS